MRVPVMRNTHCPLVSLVDTHTHTHTHLPHSCAMTYYGVGDAQMCMQSGRRATESGVYLRLGGCTHRSPVQDHGHLGGLVHVAAERSAGPCARVAVVLPAATAAAAGPQAWRRADRRESVGANTSDPLRPPIHFLLMLFLASSRCCVTHSGQRLRVTSYM